MLEVLEEERSPVAPISVGKHLPPPETPDVIAGEIREVLKFGHAYGRPLTIETVQVDVPYPVPAYMARLPVVSGGDAVKIIWPLLGQVIRDLTSRTRPHHLHLRKGNLFT